MEGKRSMSQQKLHPGTTHGVNKGLGSMSHETSEPVEGPGSGASAGNLGKQLATAGPCGRSGPFRLGGLSKYLLEKAQSNDSGLDLSPATLQTLVHPLRTSNSSSTSSLTLNSRSLFESPASSDEYTQPELLDSSLTKNQNQISLNDNISSTSPISKSIFSEQSHTSTSSSTNTTVIEKTITDDTTSRDISRKDHPGPVEYRNAAVLKEMTNADHKFQQQTYQRNFQNPDDVTPKDRNFQVPYAVGQNEQNDKPKEPISINNIENTEPCLRVAPGRGSGQSYNPNNSNSFTSAEVAAIIPPNNEGSRKVAHQTPRPKSCKKKPPPNPPSTKKQTGWKFLSEHVLGREFLILQQLGKGGCGEVSLVMEKDTRKQYALKIVQLHGIDEAVVQECINEVEMLIDLKGTDLVVDIQSWEFNRSEKTMKILMEKGQCDLNYTINKSVRSNRPMKLLKIKYIWESLLGIVAKIHSKGIVHADLKPANFVWVEDNLKIIDFGIASRLQSDLTSITMANPKGTLNYISPEIIRLDDSGRSKLSPKSDIWALGCILYLIVYGRTPFEHISHPVTKMNAIVQGEIMYSTLPAHLQESDVLSVLKLCFQTDYKRRPTAVDLLKHPFLLS